MLARVGISETSAPTEQVNITTARRVPVVEAASPADTSASESAGGAKLPPPMPALPAAPITPSVVPLETPLQSTTTLLPLVPSAPLAEPTTEIQSDFPRISGIDLTAPANDLWQRMRNGFSMPNLDSPLVADRQAWYLNRPELLKSVLNRSRRYLYYIVGELEKRGMPTELALLPMVESSYNPMAYSPARASGLWQFIPSTGKNYRLEQTWWRDQRRDIIASTGAALDYLQNIYEMNGDWHLALASYNWGEFAVSRAVARNQAKHLPTDYAHIRMPEETRYYVPKLQALKNIIAQPQLFGSKIDPIPNQPYFDTVDQTANMDVRLAAKLAETPLDEFLALNPSYNRPVMPASKSSPLVLPAGKVQIFLANLEKHEANEKPLSNWSTYTLKKGERLDKVAARFNMSTTRLKQINGIGARTHVRPGNTLLVPGANAQINDSLGEINPSQSADETPRGKGRHAAGKRGSSKAKAKPNSVHKGKSARHAASSGTRRAGKAGGSKRRGKR